jgi:NADPH-dependent glutamate synthase beta subunit-like oxidoreductase/Pyruvate/2-oxoacid:ferredoxin oxidoreductase delta subunit
MEMKNNFLSEPLIPISYGSTEVIETGKWGFQKPETAFMTAPCQEACPTGNPIPEFLYLAGEGRDEEAFRVLLRENPFPGICGRVCFHPCEIHCNRGEYDESVSIQAMERYVSDAAGHMVSDLRPKSGKNPSRIAVVGSGPAGFSSAYFLALLGHQVTVFEALREAGGVMRWGIPEYRLPKSILRKEIQRILNLGVEIRSGFRVGIDLPFSELKGFDAVFLSPGAEKNLPLKIEGEELKGVWKGKELLGRINSREKVRLGKEVVVVGGGNTAMDVARAALRLGSRVTVAYRRTKDEMPAIEEEKRDAEEEGVRFEFLIQPVEIRLRKNKKIAVRFQHMRLGKPDASGRPRPLPMKGDLLTIEADSLVTAVGEGVDISWLPPELIQNGLLEAGPSRLDGQEHVFAGGDAIDQPRTVVTAIASGKKAAISIDLHLRGLSGDEFLPKVRAGNKGSLSMEAYRSGIEEGKWPEVKEVVPYEKINTLFFKPVQRVKGRRLSREKALQGFSEVNRGFSADQAQVSASRCFTCGTCNYCYNCYFFCPEGVISLDPAQKVKTVDLDHCKGCGTCARACPRSVVQMKEHG